MSILSKVWIILGNSSNINTEKSEMNLQIFANIRGITLMPLLAIIFVH